MGDDPNQGEENAVFRTGRRDPKVVSLQEARKKRQRERRPKSSEFLHGRIQLAPTSNDIPARIEGKRHDPIAVLAELANNEVFVLLQDDQETHAPTAKVVSRNGGKFVLIFERRDMIRTLAGEQGKGSPILGEKLFDLLRPRGVGIAVNLGHDSAALVSAASLEAYCAEFDPAPEEQPEETEPEEAPERPIDEPAEVVEESVEPVADPEPEPEGIMADAPVEHSIAPAADPEEEFEPSSSGLAIFKALLAPAGFPDSLSTALTDKFRAADLCETALLIRAEYQNGTSGFIVLFSGVNPDGQDAVEQLVTDAMRLSGREDVVLDISFLQANDPMLNRLGRVAQKIV